MVTSMTGYGRSTVCDDEGYSVSVEIRSVNSRFLDSSFRLPHSMYQFEDRLRTILKNQIARGKVDVFITLQNNFQYSVKIKSNKPVINAYLGALRDVCSDEGIEYRPDERLLMNIPDAFVRAADDECGEEVYALLEKAFDEACANIQEARKREGANLFTDVMAKLNEIRRIVGEIKVFVPEAEAKLKKRITEKYEEIMGSPPEEDRLGIEIFYYMDRACIDEEIVRLYSHMDALEKELKSEGSKGKKLDFIVQEMNREINTIASKSADYEFTSRAVAVKSEIEKIREQVQNIE